MIVIRKEKVMEILLIIQGKLLFYTNYRYLISIPKLVEI